MIVAVCGYGSSGASSVLDFLRGYSSIDVVNEEIQLFHQADGLSDLKYHLTQSRERVACNAAIKRFRRLAYHSITAHSLRKWAGKEYYGIVKDYLDDIVQASWKGRSNFDPIDCSDRLYGATMAWLVQVFSWLLRKINRSFHFPWYKTRYFSLMTEEEFDKKTQKFVAQLFKAMGVHIDRMAVMDMLLSCTNPKQGTEFLSTSVKIILVDRDPRDSVATARRSKHSNSFSPRDFNDFSNYYESLRKNTHVEGDTLVLRYEDMIYNYYETTEKIMDFLGLDHRPENEFKYFNPDISVRHTEIYKRFLTEEEGRILEARFPEKIYPFPAYTKIEQQRKNWR